MSVEGNLGLFPSSCPGACGFVEEVVANSRAGGDSRRSSTAQLSSCLQLGELEDISSVMYSLAREQINELIILCVIGGWLLDLP